MNRFSHHRTFSDAFSSKKWFSCINSLWINDNASRVISLYCLHCFISFSFPSIIKILQEKSKLMDRNKTRMWDVIEVGWWYRLNIQWWLIFEKRWERKKRWFSHAHALKREGKEESMSDGFIWWWNNNVRMWFIVWLVFFRNEMKEEGVRYCFANWRR